jgi:hypothetical protein
MKFVLLALFIAAVFADLYPVPGADFLQSGFDGLKLAGGLAPIFEWSYTKGKTFSPEIGKGALQYSVPNYVSVFDMVQSGEVVSESIYETFESWFKEVTAGFDLSVGVNIANQISASIGVNVQWGKIHTEMNSENKQMAYSNHWYTFYKLTALPALVLNKDDNFETMVSLLPTPVATSDDQDIYNQMVLAFGTHYYARLHLGAYVHFDTFLDQKITQTKDQSWLKAQASLTFHYMMWDVAFKPSYSRSSIHIDNTFALNADSHSFFAGGDPAFQSNSTLKEWQASLIQFPAVVNVTVQPLWYVMPSSPARDHLKATIEYYLTKGTVPVAPVTNYRTSVRGPYDHLLSLPAEQLREIHHIETKDPFIATHRDLHF